MNAKQKREWEKAVKNLDRAYGDAIKAISDCIEWSEKEEKKKLAKRKGKR